MKRVTREMITKILKESLEPSQDSLDDQIDSLLLRYESNAIAAAPEDEIAAESMTLKNAFNLLQEQGEEDEEEDSTTGSEDMEVDAPAEEEPTPRIDIDSFSNAVVRLLMNFDSLLDPTAVIVNRAKNLLADKYDENAVEEFEEILSQQHGIELGPGEEPPDAPPAAGAGPLGGGV